MSVRALLERKRFQAEHASRRATSRLRHTSIEFERPAGHPPFDRADFDVPSHSITTDSAWFMHDYILRHGLRHGFEVGSKFGWSGIWLASALAQNGGELVMADMKLRQKLVQNFEVAGIRNATIVLGDSTSAEVATAVQAVRSEPFDFVFIDGDHSYEGCHSDYRLACANAAAESHIFFDNMWETGGVYRVFREEPAAQKIVVTGFEPDAPGRRYRECLGIHVIRKEQPAPAGAGSRESVTAAALGGYLVTSTGKLEEGAA